MTKDDLAALKAWAKNWHEGIFLVQGRQVLELLAQLEPWPDHAASCQERIDNMDCEE
jgi:hypothetical protein